MIFNSKRRKIGKKQSKTFQLHLDDIEFQDLFVYDWMYNRIKPNSIEESNQAD